MNDSARFGATLTKKGSDTYNKWSRKADPDDRLMTGYMLESLDDYSRNRTKARTTMGDMGIQKDKIPSNGINENTNRADDNSNNYNQRYNNNGLNPDCYPDDVQYYEDIPTEGAYRRRNFSPSPTFYKYAKDIAMQRAQLRRDPGSSQVGQRSKSVNTFKTQMKPIKYYKMGHFLATTQSNITMNELEGCSTGVIWKDKYAQTNYGKTFRLQGREPAHCDEDEGRMTQTLLKKHRAQPLSKDFTQSGLFSLNEVERRNAQTDFTKEFTSTYGKTNQYKPNATRYKLDIPPYDKNTTQRSSYEIPSEGMKDKLSEIANNTTKCAEALKANGISGNPMGLDKNYMYNKTSSYTDNNMLVTQYNAKVKRDVQREETRQMKAYIEKNGPPYVDAENAQEWIDTVPHDVKTRFTGFVREMRLLDNDY